MLEERRDTMGGDFNYIVSKYTPFDKIIENLKKKYRVQSLTEEEIPNLAMHRFNTAHLPAIESLGLSEEQLQIKAIKIIIDEHSRHYVHKDYVPVAFNILTEPRDSVCKTVERKVSVFNQMLQNTLAFFL